MTRLVTRREPLRMDFPRTPDTVPPPGPPRCNPLTGMPLPQRENPAVAARRAGGRGNTAAPLTRAAREHNYRRQTGRRTLTARQHRRVEHKAHRNPEKE